jgi:hypothetical protein
MCAEMETADDDRVAVSWGAAPRVDAGFCFAHASAPRAAAR